MPRAIRQLRECYSRRNDPVPLEQLVAYHWCFDLVAQALVMLACVYGGWLCGAGSPQHSHRQKYRYHGGGSAVAARERTRVNVNTTHVYKGAGGSRDKHGSHGYPDYTATMSHRFQPNTTTSKRQTAQTHRQPHPHDSTGTVGKHRSGGAGGGGISRDTADGSSPPGSSIHTCHMPVSSHPRAAHSSASVARLGRMCGGVRPLERRGL